MPLSCNRSKKSFDLSSSTKPSPSSKFSFSHPTRTNKAMEDVWKDINLSSLNDQITHPITTTTTQSAKFQDFLPPPFTIAIDPPTSLPSTSLSLSTQPHYNTASKVHPFQNKSSLQPHTNSGNMPKSRIMKNRESATRSRARKQAYLFELKQKVKHLQEENERLKRQQKLMCETAAKQLNKRGNLYRSSTAPF